MTFFVYLAMIVSFHQVIGVEVWPGIAASYAADFDALPIAAARSFIRWNEVEQSPGVYTWNVNTDADMALLDDKHVHPIIVSIHDTPAFYRRTGETRSCAPPDEKYINQLKSFATAASLRYPVVDVWEFWNEPELGAGHDGYYGCWGDYGGAVYGRFIRGFYDAINAVDNKDLVMFGSMTSDGTPFARQAKQAGGLWDVYGLHVYADTDTSFADTQAWADRISQSLGDAPVWITETSYCSHVIDERKQADWLKYVHKNMASKYPVVVWYSLADPDWRNAGMYDGDRRKQVWYEFRDLYGISYK